MSELSAVVASFFRQDPDRSPSQDLAAAEAVQEAVATELAALLRGTLNEYLDSPMLQDTVSRSSLVEAFNGQLVKLQLGIKHPVTGRPSFLIAGRGENAVGELGLIELAVDRQKYFELAEDQIKLLQYVPARTYSSGIFPSSSQTLRYHFELENNALVPTFG